MSKHSASAISEPVFPLNRNFAVAFHPFSVCKGSKDLIMTITIVTKLPLNTVSPRSQRDIEETVSIIFTVTTITGSMVAVSVGPTTV